MVHDSSAVTAKLKQDETVVLQMDDQQSIVDSTTSYLRVAGVIPIAAFFIVVQEGMERFAYYGGSTPFQNYIQLPAQNNSEKAIEVLPGALDMGQDTATACNLAFTFCCYATPLIGAYISDQYW